VEGLQDVDGELANHGSVQLVVLQGRHVGLVVVAAEW
jgi:hypothetical protein